MFVFEVTIALLLVGVALTALSRRVGTPYPAMLALAGAGLALVPKTPTLILDPELALTLFVAPVLVDAAFDASPRDLRANWRSVAGLALGAVAVTIALVALAARWLVPSMPWSVAVALGAIVAPPDAAAATAVLKQLRPPQRLLVILEGESLFNDASALLVFRLAVGIAIAGAPPSIATAVPPLLLVTGASLVLGVVLARAVQALTQRIRDVAIAVVLQFCGTFAVWMIAERLHLSGVLTMVSFAMAISRRAAEVTPARIRIPSYAVWEVTVFVLNVLAFILIGFQLKGILERIDARTTLAYTGVAAVVCGTAIAARIAWVSLAAAFSRWRCSGGAEDAVALTPRAAALVGWCGMRGIVTLAAALALPTTTETGAPFPCRDLVLFVAFSVTLGTLVLQGMTLRPLMHALRLQDDGAVDREVKLGRIEMYRAALAVTAEQPGAELASLVHRRYELMLRRAEGEPTASRADGEALAAALAAERRRLVVLRANGTIGDPAFQRLEEALDREEMHLAELVHAAEGPRPE